MVYSKVFRFSRELQCGSKRLQYVLILRPTACWGDPGTIYFALLRGAPGYPDAVFFVLLKEPQQRKYSGTVPPSKRHRLSVDRMQSQYNLIHSSALRERRVRFHRRQVPSVRTK